MSGKRMCRWCHQEVNGAPVLAGAKFANLVREGERVHWLASSQEQQSEVEQIFDLNHPEAA